MSASIHEEVQEILHEIGSVLGQVSEKEVEALISEIEGAGNIVTAGAGRVGLATKAFAMRLGHLGYAAHALGDMTVPGIAKGDLLLVASGSGETPTIAHIVEVAKKSGATIVLLTSNRESRMGKLADTLVVIPAPSKASPGSVTSKQPMTTLNEQCLTIFFDALVLQLLEKVGADETLLWKRHSNLE